MGGIPGGRGPSANARSTFAVTWRAKAVAVPSIPCGPSPKIASAQRIVPALKTPAPLECV